MNDSNELQRLRDEIDGIDRSLQALINRRAQCAAQVALVKQQEFEASGRDNPDEGEVLYYRPEREAQVLRKVMECNTGPLSGPAMAGIFREIMSACLALEQPLRVAYLGPGGTFTQAAALKHFGHAVMTRPQQTIPHVFAQVESGECGHGVVPVENSTEGMVSHTLDHFMDSPLFICGEVELRIELHLLASAEARNEGISTICAHQQALAQSRNWLDRNWPGVDRVSVSSNAKAARIAAGDPTVAAVAGAMAAECYALQRLATNIEDYPDNTTRFLILGREAVPPSGKDKTSIIVSAHNKPGALFHLLEPFEREGVGLTRIDTRPSRTERWAYVFFMEFEGHLRDPHIVKIMKELEAQSMLLKPLGSYPQAVI